ncbi:MAG: exodeoxyribonuclease VII large subunit [Clostridiales bacterium]|jgi:exodeoxyribonuclease VII large subunit|nr:exodeoxyribonuclease VII large subunit [Clostridiales bacterium]
MRRDSFGRVKDLKGHIFSISEVNQYIKYKMENDPNLSLIYVRGEISNYKPHSSGHHYMTLKDENAVLRAVMFKSDALKLKFKPENGIKIIAKGRISVFPRDGQYQLYITDMIPDGVGALYVAFEQLKKKLAAEGLFDADKKKPVPKYPGRIALVTSPTGAAVRDMLRILKARFPLAKILVCPVLVQGEGAAGEIAAAIYRLNEKSMCDLIITGRGGGSIEDLWAFNEECVARAIFASEIPVISAVGHEPDVTISDFVADLRAATPSNAAELAVPDCVSIKSSLNDANIRIIQAVTHKIRFYREVLAKISEKPVMQSPLAYFQERRMLLDYTGDKLDSLIHKRISDYKQRFIGLASALDALSPLKVLARGYSITTDSDGRVIKDVSGVNVGDRINIRLNAANLDCSVNNVKKLKD